MGASSYLTRKPWGPASSRSTRAEGRAPPHEKESPARFRSIAGGSHLPRPARLERARTSQGFETPPQAWARTRNPKEHLACLPGPLCPRRPYSQRPALDTDLLNGAPHPYTEQRKRHQRQETPRPEPGPASPSTLQSRIRRGQENAGAASPSFLRMQRRRHKRSNELPFSMQ